jgi:hypothetical protein
MKTSKLIVNSLAVIFAGVTACQSETSNKAASHEDHEQQSTASVAPEFKDQNVKDIYQHYIHVKSALVKADVKEAQAGASALSTAFTKVGNKNGAALAGKIASASNIAAQRIELDGLTSEVEKAIKGSGLKSGVVYKQYCPMAKEGNGAYWLASESKVNNPYYGSEMLECGEVKEEIK